MAGMLGGLQYKINLVRNACDVQYQEELGAQMMCSIFPATTLNILIIYFKKYKNIVNFFFQKHFIYEIVKIKHIKNKLYQYFSFVFENPINVIFLCI